MVATEKTSVDTQPRSTQKQRSGKHAVDAQILERLKDPARDFIVAVIPAYNEERFIGSVVLRALNFAATVLVVDDGSADNTAQIARSAGATVVCHESNQGKGAALNTGFQSARQFEPQVVVCLDADGQHLPDEIGLLIEPIITQQADLVVGSRYLGAKGFTPRHRVWGHWVFNLLTRYASGVESSDSQSGFRAFSPRALQAVSFSSQDFSVESEMQFLAQEHDLRVIEVPVTIRYPDPPKRSVLGHGMRVLNGILRLVGQHRPLFYFGVPGFIIFSFGILLGLRVIDIFSHTSQLAIGTALITVLLSMVGMILISTGFTIHSIRALLSNMLIPKHNKDE